MKKHIICLILEILIFLSIPLFVNIPKEIVIEISEQKTLSPTSTITMDTTGTPYQDGNAVDEEALAWSNLDDVVDKWGGSSGSDDTTFLHSESDDLNEVVIAIIDMGITDVIWEQIENLTDCEIEVYVDWDYSPNLVPYHTLTTSDPDDLPDHLDLEYEEKSEHGSNIAWLISQAVNGVKLWILDIQTADDRDYQNVDGTTKALEWLYLHKDDYSGLDIVSMSFSSPDSDQDCEDALDELEQDGIILMAAAGNAIGTEDVDTLRYPRSYSSVWGIGAHFDDIDGSFEDDQTNDYPGYRVTKSKSDDFRDSMQDWGSQYKSSPSEGQSVEFMAPGFDYETRFRNLTYQVTDGTSYACPHAASIAAYAIATCNYAFNYTQNDIWVYVFEALKKASEKSSLYSDRVGFNDITEEGCQINSVYPSSPTADDKIGYGSIDAYDAVRYLLGGEVISGETTISYGMYDSNPCYSKSSTKVNIFRPGTYIMRATYLVNAIPFFTSDQNQTFTTSGEHVVPFRWLASTNPGDTIGVKWAIIHPTTMKILDQESSFTIYHIPFPGRLLNPDSDPDIIGDIWDCHIDAQGDPNDPVIAHVAFEVDVTGYYAVKVEYKVDSGSGWGPKSTFWHNATKNAGKYYYNDNIGTVQEGYKYWVRWTIYFIPGEDNIAISMQVEAASS